MSVMVVEASATETRLRRDVTAKALLGLALALLTASSVAAPSPEEIRHRDTITRVAREARVEPALLMAVVKVESNFDARARHPDGPMGLTQITPTTARSVQPGIRHADLLEPEKNLRVGARHLRQLLDEFKDPRLAVAAYQAGAGRVKANRSGILKDPHTGRHVSRVMQAYDGYRKQAPVQSANRAAPRGKIAAARTINRMAKQIDPLQKTTLAARQPDGQTRSASKGS